MEEDAGEYKKKYVIIEGIHYIIGVPASQQTCGAGFGGKEFKIKFFDGRRVTTDNLRSQGRITENFRKMMPDNAEFEAHGS